VGHRFADAFECAAVLGRAGLSVAPAAQLGFCALGPVAVDARPGRADCERLLGVLPRGSDGVNV
jgi:hypothetical protein